MPLRSERRLPVPLALLALALQLAPVHPSTVSLRQAQGVPNLSRDSGRPELAEGRADAPPISLHDVTPGTGIGFTLENHPTPQKHLIETMPSGLAAFDYNSDGLTDLYFTNGASVPDLVKKTPSDWNRLYRNDGGLKFTDVTEQAGVRGEGYSMGAAAADYDNDDHVDLFVAGVERNILYRNTGRGTFEDVTGRAGIASRSWSVAAGWLDVDRDGLLDLFVVNYLKGSIGRRDRSTTAAGRSLGNRV